MAAEDNEDATNFLVPRQKYLASGIHIGMKQRTAHMAQFVYKIRPDGLAVMNLQMIDERIRIAAKFLASIDKIMIVSRRNVAQEPIQKFVDIVGGKLIKSRFMPGTLTNPKYKNFYEADALVVVDPMSDYQAIKEATTARMPVIAVCDTFNETYNIDLIIPANNKGIKALAMLFWLLAREIMKARGKIKSDEEFKYQVEDFMKESELKMKEIEERENRGPGRRRERGERDSRRRSKSSRPMPEPTEPEASEKSSEEATEDVVIDQEGAEVPADTAAAAAVSEEMVGTEKEAAKSVALDTNGKLKGDSEESE